MVQFPLCLLNILLLIVVIGLTVRWPAAISSALLKYSVLRTMSTRTLVGMAVMPSVELYCKTRAVGVNYTDIKEITHHFISS